MRIDKGGEEKGKVFFLNASKVRSLAYISKSMRRSK